MTGRRNTLRCVTTSSGSPHFAATSARLTPSPTSLVPQRMVSAQADDVASRPTSRRATLRFMGFTIGRIPLTGNERCPVSEACYARCIEPFIRLDTLIGMGPSVHWKALLVLSLGLACASHAHAGPFILTAAETQRVEARQVVIRSSLDSSQRRGTVRAAVRIEAPPDVVFRMMIQCADALVYVPHLRACHVRDQAPD